MMNLLFSPLGKVGLVLAALAAWTLYQRHDAARDAEAQCQEKNLRAALKELARQHDAAKETIKLAQRQQAITDQEMADLEAEKGRILRDAAKLKSCEFVVPDDVLQRMRNIR